MNPTKPFHEKSRSSQERYVGLKKPLCFIWDDEIDLLRAVKPEYAHAFIQLLPYFKSGKGYLEDHGKPTSNKVIASQTGISERVIGDTLRELSRAKFRILSRDDRKVYYHVRMSVRFANDSQQPARTTNDPQRPETPQNETSPVGTFTREDPKTKDPNNNNSTLQNKTNVSESSFFDNNNHSIGADVRQEPPAPASRPGSASADIGGCLNVPGARLADDVTVEWIKSVRPWLKYKPIAAHFPQIIRDCVKHWTNQGIEVSQAQIFASLNFALKKTQPAPSPAEPKTPTPAPTPKRMKFKI
jgi:hypothetical protein